MMMLVASWLMLCHASVPPSSSDADRTSAEAVAAIFRPIVHVPLPFSYYPTLILRLFYFFGSSGADLKMNFSTIVSARYSSSSAFSAPMFSSSGTDAFGT